MKFLVFVIFVSSFFIFGTAINTQSSGAKGILQCNSMPEANTIIKLFDDDSGIDDDDLMGSTRSNKDGKFEISGYEDELTPIDPKLIIYTDCNDGPKPCQRKITVKIPSIYITSGKIAKKIYDAGVIQLSGTFPGEERDCIN
uniref:Uncharacterized protein n=1 Tax=Panagrolaimus sp. PS1159 TaxID=55785 RepID=A0AC35GGW7_9BILA